MILRLIQGDARICGRILRLLLLTIIPFITLIVAVASLFYLNVFLTFVILFLIGISAVFQYRVNIRGAKNYSLVEKHSKVSSSEFRKIIQWLKGSANPLSTGSSWLDTVLTRGSIKRHLDAYEGHLKAMENSRLVNNILSAIAIFAILGTLGASIIKEGQGWGKLIIYLVALRYALVNATSTIMKVTSLNRFYPQLRRYFQFLENTGTPLRSDNVRSEKYIISTQSDVIDGSLERWTLNRSGRIGLVSPVTLNRYTVAFLTDCLLGHAQEASKNALGSMCFVTSYYGNLPMGLRESLGFPRGYDWNDFRKDTEGAGLWDRIEKQLPHEMEKTISHDTWIKIDRDLKFALSLLTALHSDAQWVMLEEKGLLTLPEVAREFFLNRLSDRVTVIVFNNEIAAVGNYNEEVIAVINENGIVGLGSAEWIKKNESTIKDILSRGSLRDSRLGVLEDDVDEDLDDDDM
jgi:hypothetical protein